MDAVIEIQALTKRFGEISAVDGLDLTVRKGEMFCIVGPDGAGKTTTIRLLCGIIKPTKGNIVILGDKLDGDLGRNKSRIGYLSQRFSLYGDLSADENIEFFAEIHGVRDFKKRREDLLNFTRLEPFRKRLADQLSGGMKQKLALACTLIHAPDLLLLDEPTTGVDVVSRREFWKILSSLLKTGMTIVMTTPYLDEAERCSRVALMNKGTLVAVDTPQAIKTLMSGTVIEIICPEIRKAFYALKSSPGVREVQAFGDRINIVVEDPEREMPGIRRHLETEGLGVIRWRRIPTSIENVFISMTGTR